MPAVIHRKPSSSLAEFPELARLPKAKRLKLADELWMSGIADDSPVPQWHQETLDQRWKDYQAGKTKRLTLKQLEQRLAKR
ncbi:addiction module protein [Prosthecobacter sp.]|jgi:putative addiction module component (TIGR02574 family)|uniref:addiction module protein n=1 Tax=Prosthecobacter sp. TaxID=1965333 RepID=UPI0037850EE5